MDALQSTHFYQVCLVFLLKPHGNSKDEKDFQLCHVLGQFRGEVMQRSLHCTTWLILSVGGHICFQVQLHGHAACAITWGHVLRNTWFSDLLLPS